MKPIITSHESTALSACELQKLLACFFTIEQRKCEQIVKLVCQVVMSSLKYVQILDWEMFSILFKTFNDTYNEKILETPKSEYWNWHQK